MLNLCVPDYILSKHNIFDLRQKDWENSLVSNITKMLQCGEQYGIRVSSISVERPEKVDRSELKQTISRILKISMVHGDNKTLDLEYEIPWLVDNHFFIGGNKKVSIFQLFDRPLIRRNDIIKLRTNIHNFTLTKKQRLRRPYFYYVTLFGKEVPFCYLVYAYLGEDKIKDRFGITKEDSLSTNVTIDYDLAQDIKDLIDSPSSKKRLLSQYFNRKEDVDIVNNVLLISEVDIFTKEFLTTPNVLEELISSLGDWDNDDLDYSNKRIRFSEQLVYSHLARDFYQMIVSLRQSKKNRFRNNSKVILNNINQSAIVQFDFSINPLSELAMLTRLSLSGPGGFEKGNVPPYLRDIHPSMKSHVCPADTGDRENCGTVQYLTPTIQLGNDLTFNKGEGDCRNSIAISHVPFLEHDDPTRLQMSSSQQRHAIMLENFDVPLVQSGVEGMYTKYTSFCFVASRDGTVVFKDDSVIVVQFDNKKCQAFNIGYKKLFLSIYDFYHVYFDIGHTFKKDQMIAESNYLKQGRLTVGKNLLTAVTIWHGYNFEDAIVISDRLVKDNELTSVHYLDLTFEVPPNKLLLNLGDDETAYKGIPNIGDVLTKGDIYAKIKTLTGINDSLDMIFDEPFEKVVTEDCVITDVKLFANKWNKEFPQYDTFVTSLIAQKNKDRTSMIDNLSTYLSQDQLGHFLESIAIDNTEKKRGTYKVKGGSIDGIRFEITAMYKRPIEVGDKIGNRHGNKGIISKIVPEHEMPRLENGQSADVVLNPLGVISRMNIGQLFELHMAMSVQDMRNIIVKKFEDKEEEEEIKEFILNYIKIIDSTKNKEYTHQMKLFLEAVSVEYIVNHIDSFYVIQPPYESTPVDKLSEAMDYTGTRMEYPCYDPYGDDEHNKDPSYFEQNIINEIAVGYQYFIKMNHISKDKIAHRGVGPYSSKTCQPLDGKNRKGGQRLGEMEVWAVAGHGAESNLWEFLTTKSDSIKKRNATISKMIQNDDMKLDENDDDVSQSIRLFQSELKTMGLDYEIKEEL
jgi:DNA-directed RNA polymerase beta subunit